MNKFIPIIMISTIISACSGWVIQPLPNNPPTPIRVSTSTPAIYSPTPLILGATSSSVTPDPEATSTLLPTTTMGSATPTLTPNESHTPTSLVNGPGLQIIILGCDTGLDISHGMGEVTNAYVTLKNIGNVELTNLVITLYALDEGREHPDKVQEVTSLPTHYEVSLKLTVDSTYKEETPIQVEVYSDQRLFPREGSASCREIGLFSTKPEGLKTPVPINP